MRDLSSTFARWEEGFWWGEEWDFEGFGVGFEEEDDDIVRRKKEKERRRGLGGMVLRKEWKKKKGF